MHWRPRFDGWLAVCYTNLNQSNLIADGCQIFDKKIHDPVKNRHFFPKFGDFWRKNNEPNSFTVEIVIFNRFAAGFVDGAFWSPVCSRLSKVNTADCAT